MQQNKVEKVPVYVTRLKRALNLVKIEHPQRISEREFQGYLRDWLFRGQRKAQRDLLRNLYDD